MKKKSIMWERPFETYCKLSLKMNIVVKILVHDNNKIVSLHWWRITTSYLNYTLLKIEKDINIFHSIYEITDNSCWRYLLDVLAFVFVGLVQVKGLGGVDKLCSPSNIWTTSFIEGRSTGNHWIHQSPIIVNFFYYLSISFFINSNL